ncbi:MAG TPA: PQQ-dependent sugar dehydrogenase [Bacteroidia bacterium]|nr:PQQ-dependent sugar dehydrogenase [Bacteroidia bacterium]
MKTKLLISLCLINFTAFGQVTLQTNIFASAFDAPVAIANCGDSRLFVVERAGKIIIANENGTKEATPFLDIDSIVNNGNDERGLLGLAFDPSYASNGFFYVYFAL